MIIASGGGGGQGMLERLGVTPKESNKLHPLLSLAMPLGPQGAKGTHISLQGPPSLSAHGRQSLQVLLFSDLLIN